VANRFGELAANQLLEVSRQFIDTGKLTAHHNKLQLTKEGKLFADGIAAALFS
jgi:oxygen-independent coproporphyrinogen-3 oxidase